ncbi:MAG: DUF11 domain-containing protein [Candidatus Riflebacteria bacterium]|nr:DUF11 domain-containing protein [Candidatus Riflebacteria bacterium]
MARASTDPGVFNPETRRPAFFAVCLLAFLALGPGPAWGVCNPTVVAFPATSNPYWRSDGQAIYDLIGEPGIAPDAVDIFSGGAPPGPGPRPSCYVSFSQTHAFFRLRLKTDPTGAGTAKGGFIEYCYIVYVGSNGTTVGSVGVNGKNGNGPDHVFVNDFTTVTDIFDVSTYQGARGLSDGADGYFIDWQIPLQCIFTYLPVNRDSPLQFFYATSTAASDQTINKDAMMPIPGNTPVYTGLQVISLKPAYLEITKTYTVVSGPNPPVAETVTTYNLTIEVKNSGGNTAESPSVQDLIPPSPAIKQVQTNNGSINKTGQTVDWSPPSITFGSTVTAVVTVDLTPTVLQVGQYIPLNNSCTATASDPQAGGTTTTVWPGPALQVGPVVAAASGHELSGTVYADANHNSLLDAGESGTGLVLYAKRVPSGSPSGPADAAVSITPSSGAFVFSGVDDGTYAIVLDDNSTLSDVTPTLPAAWLGTNAPGLARSVTMNGVDLSGVDFGLFNGARVSGTVFGDTGAGGGTANNGQKDGTEAGLAGLVVTARNAADVVLDRTATGGDGTYVLYIPHGSTTVKVVETNQDGTLSTGGNPGNSGGTYTRSSDTTQYTYAAGTSPTGVDFGDVPVNDLTPDGLASGLPGSMVFYRHTFTAGTSGQVTFSTSHASTPLATGWQNVLYRDTDCDGTIDAGELPVSAALDVTAGQSICLVVTEFVPANAAVGAQDQVAVNAGFDYTGAGPELEAQSTRSDVTQVGLPSGAGLSLTKTADKATARPADIITYTITYSNRSRDNLSGLFLFDATPPFTTYLDAACGTSPAGITDCAVTSQPDPGAKGNLKWTLTGTLAPGASGTVTYRVTVE